MKDKEKYCYLPQKCIFSELSWYVIWLIMWGCCDMFVGWLALDTVDRMQIRSHFTLILHLATRHCCYWLLLYHITHPSPHHTSRL